MAQQAAELSRPLLLIAANWLDMASASIRPFDAAPTKYCADRSGWSRLAENVRQRNESKQQCGCTPAPDLPPHLPEQDGDAIWRYTFAAPSAAAAN
jgi:hypothetical protein